MKTILLALLFCSSSLFAQTETVGTITVGSSGDIVNQPVSVSSEFTHSQTLYYPNELGFTGTINEIRFKKLFTSSSLTNSDEWIVKIGVTDTEEFGSSADIINTTDFSEVFNGTVSQNGYDVIITFDTPFYYDGTQNLLLDIQETAPGIGSNSSAFKGEENFGNPPVRSLMIFTTNGNSQTLVENSFAQTEFIGELETCPTVQNPTIDNVTETSATVHLQDDENITGYRYNVNVIGNPVPDDYTVTSSTEIQLDNLEPASDYALNIKSDCDVYEANYQSYGFTTKIVHLLLPSSISFDETTNPGTYYLSSGYKATSEVSNLAGTNGSNGLLFRGPETFESWTPNNIWYNNYQFISRASFIVDVPEDATNPIFKFDFKQDAESYFRLKINGIVQDFEYEGVVEDNGDFKTVTVDLSPYEGENINLVMEHISKYSGTGESSSGYIKKALVDNISVQEATCEKPDNITIEALTATTNQLTLSSSSGEMSGNWQIITVPHDENPAEASPVDFTNLPYAIENLEPASAYDIYLRTTCGEDFSTWKKIMQSTQPELIQIPYEENFEAFDDYFAPIYHGASKITLQSTNKLVLSQRNTDLEWVGGFETTEQQAYNDNTEFSTSLKFRVNATNLSELTMELRFKLYYFFAPETSWFRILINGNQIGDSYNPTNPSTSPYQIQTIDLSNYVGNIVEVTLEHVGRSDEYAFYGAMDAVTMDYVNFTGEISCPTPTDVEVSNLTANTADLSWSPGGSETHWIVKYGASDFNPDTEGMEFSVDENPTTVLTGLDANTEYDVYVRADCDDSGLSLWAGPENFTTEMGSCDAPTSIVLDNITSTTADISWNSNSDETQWEVVYGLEGIDPDNQENSVEVNENPEITLTDLDPNTDYDVYVRAICGENNFSDWFGPENFTTEMEPCDAPTSIVLDNITSTTADISWNSNGDETQWEVVYGLEGIDPNNEDNSVEVNGNPEITLTDLEADTDYDVYVRAICGENNISDWFGPEQFTSEMEPCDAPTSIVLDNITSTTADISWNSNSDETHWEVVYGLEGIDPDNEENSVEVNGNPEITLTDLEADTDYDVYVRAICGENNVSDWFGPENFSTEALSLDSRYFENFTFYPNPVKNKLTLKAGMPIKAVNVYNLLGQMVITAFPKRLQTQINIENLQSGVYLMKVNISGRTKTFKVIKK